jgi:hypothetical protein
MGTNLSQVFISNTDVLESGSTFGDIAANEVGIWKLDGTPAYVNSKLYELTVASAGAVVNTGDAGAADDPVLSQTTVANPLWLYNNLQFVQKASAGNPLASPIINTRNIRRITYDPFQAFVGHGATIADATLNVTGAADGDEYDFKFIIRTTPTDYLSFYDQDGLAIFGDFPLAAFNTTNHKAINMTVKIADVDDADAAGNLTAIQAGIAANPILKAMFTAADDATTAANLRITANHPGVIFDLIIENVTREATTDPVSAAAVPGTNGCGNDFQVIGEEMRCRSRYAQFNRMYIPQNMTTYGKKSFKYDKITIEYEHNWPNSTGIAPAGALNQVVLYNTDTDGTAPASGEGTFEAAFGITNATAKRFIW